MSVDTVVRMMIEGQAYKHQRYHRRVGKVPRRQVRRGSRRWRQFVVGQFVDLYHRPCSWYRPFVEEVTGFAVVVVVVPLMDSCYCSLSTKPVVVVGLYCCYWVLASKIVVEVVAGTVAVVVVGVAVHS